MKAYLVINGEKMTPKSLFGTWDNTGIYRTIAEAKKGIEMWRADPDAWNIVELHFYDNLLDGSHCFVRILPKTTIRRHI